MRGAGGPLGHGSVAIANRRSSACISSVLGCRPGKTLPMLIVPADAPDGAGLAQRRSRGRRGPKKPIHPALLELEEERARSVQDRIADAITRFAGSMWFAYLHPTSDST
jgi:hypothetical protein